MNLRLGHFFMSVMILTAILSLFFVSTAMARPAKYVFLFIGDGMGLPQRAAAAKYLGKDLLMDSFPAQGITTTYAADRFITGSAAAATAIASGHKTNIGMVGRDPQLQPVKTIAEMAHEQGMKVGIVSSVSIDHATPAAFYAHVPKRGQYYDIDVALSRSGFEYFGGGGLKDPGNSRNNTERFYGNALELIKKNGYTLITDKERFMALRPDNGKVLAINAWLQDNQALPYAMDHRDEDISLAEFTAKGIELLQDDPDGFFLMIEGGKIDWACHANDGAAAIHDTFAFDQSIEEAYRFYQAHPQDTLIVVTGDHECGGMTLGFAGTKYVTNFEVLSKQRVSFQKFDHQIAAQFKESEATFADVKPIITKYFGLKFDAGPGDPLALASHELTKIHTSFERYVSRDIEKSNDPNTYLLYGGYNPLSITLTHILNQKAGIGWTSYKHTGVPVCTSAIGVDSETFNGSYDNTDIARKIMRAMELEPQVASSSHTKKDSATAHSYGNGCIRSGGLSQRGAACLISGVL